MHRRCATNSASRAVVRRSGQRLPAIRSHTLAVNSLLKRFDLFPNARPVGERYGVERMLTILELAEQAVAVSQEEDPEPSDLTVATILRFLHTDGSLNRHLANPLNNPLQYYSEPRGIPLSGKEPVYGTCQALIYCRHDLSVRLYSYDAVEALEQFLASDAGCIHPYVTYCVAFVAGKVERYRIGYTVEGGLTRLFDKSQSGPRFRHPALQAAERWIVWNRPIQKEEVTCND